MNLSILAVGQAGGNIANLFSEKGYPALVINSSQRDLETCQNIDPNHRLHLVNSEGAGKDREEAIRLITNNWESCLSFVKEHFSQPSTELIFVIFSCGGGTGSGSSPLLLNILTNELESKTIVACPILPSKNDSILAHINTLECLEQLSELDICIIPIDNSKADSDSKNQIYNQINHSFVDLVDSIVKQTELNSQYGNLDRKDMLNLFKTPGFCCLSHVDIANVNKTISLTSDSITHAITDSWDNSIITSPSYSKLIRFGLIFNGQENFMPLIITKNILNDFGNSPLDIYEGYYTQNKGDIYTILTGLTFNTDRLKQIEYKTTHETESLQNALTASHSISYKPSSLNIKPVDKQKKALSSILSKYQKKL
jgi:tubulin-like protein CetZ